MKAKELVNVNPGTSVCVPWDGVNPICGKLVEAKVNSGWICVTTRIDIGNGYEKLVELELDEEVSVHEGEYLEAIGAEAIRLIGTPENPQDLSGFLKDVDTTFEENYSISDWLMEIDYGNWLVKRKGKVVLLDNESFEALFR